MSEQTPTSTDDLNGSEPSMEDILASIRKIISEDEPVAMESPEDIQPMELVSENATASAHEALSDFTQTPNETLSNLDLDAGLGDATSGSVDLNIDDVLASLAGDELEEIANFEPQDLQIPEIPADASEHYNHDNLKPDLETPTTIDSDIGITFENDDDILSLLDGDGATVSNDVETLMDSGAEPVLSSGIAELVATVDTAAPVSFDSGSANDDAEMDALLDEILLTPDESSDDVFEELVSEELVSEDVAEGFVDEPAEFSDAEQSDLDLVKSLLADLSDDPGSETMDEGLDALIDLEDASLDDAALTDVGEPVELTADAEEDILGDILGMTIDDELQNQPDELELADLASFGNVAAAEQENILENTLLSGAADITADEAVTDLPSLSEIAAAAQADALEVEAPKPKETSPTFVAVLGAAAAGTSAAVFAAKQTKQAEMEAEAEAEAVAEAELDAEAEFETALLENVEPANVEAEIIELETTEAELTDIEIAETDVSAIETSTETITKSISTQETSMPVKAVNTDTIIDVVTESATAGAFAELNQVVEDKAIFNERGPRIGDLVQDALRPMLKEWLDANLKGIVERAVTKEVKRISSGK